MPNPLLAKEFAGEEAIIDAAAHSRELPMEATSGESMTMSGVLRATGVLLVLVLVGAAFGWQTSASQSVVLWVSTAVMLAAALITVFKPEWARITGSVYALAEGVALGAISRVFSDVYDGIVFQAVIATIAVFLAMLLLYVGRVIKVTERLRSTIILATVGIGLFYLASFLFSLFGLSVPLVWDGGWPSIVLSLVVVVAASLNLVLDFDLIERGVAGKAPAFMSWYAAFALMVTIVWLYLEMLRLIALIRSR